MPLIYRGLCTFRPTASEPAASLIVPTCPNTPGTHWGKFSLLIDDRLHLAEVAAVDRDDLPPEVQHDRKVEELWQPICQGGEACEGLGSLLRGKALQLTVKLAALLADHDSLDYGRIKPLA